MLLYIQMIGYSILLHANLCTSISNNLEISKTCPTWTYPSPPHNECVCGNAPGISCDQDTLTVSVRAGHNICMFFSDNLQTILIGTCPYIFNGQIPRNTSQIMEEISKLCLLQHRTGPLCGECVENYTLPAYSYNLGCIRCESYKNGWIKFIAAAFLPVTLFYIIVITFRLSVTSSSLNAFVMIHQIVAIPPVIRQIYSSNQVISSYHVSYTGQYSVDFLIAIFAFWNLDYFRSFYGPICLYPNINYQHVLLLEYAIGVYPLFLILLTYIFVKLHDNSSVVVWLWKTFHRCLASVRRQWNTQSYLVHALATFIVLSYIKILNTSFEFLIPSHVFNMKGQNVNKFLWYYNGSVDMTSKGYLPYLVLAIFMLVFFNILPLLLLALYPFKWFQKFLIGHLPLKFKLALQIFMDTFHGCFEDTAHDYRHFATLYMAVRFLNLLIVSVFSSRLYNSAVSFLFAFTVVLVAWFQPYKCKRSNKVDVVMLLVMITGYTSLTLYSLELYLFPKWLRGAILAAVILIIYGYLGFLILASIISRFQVCFTEGKFRLLTCIKITCKHCVTNEEDQALLIT